MAAGDIFQVFDTDVATGAFMTIQAATGEEAVIHNIYVSEGDAVGIFYTNGSTTIAFDSDSVDGSRYNQNWHISSGVYLQVQNQTTTTGKVMGADGIKTK
jgi:hypothetical protein